MSIDDLDWNVVVEGLRSADPEICAAFWDRYGALLESVARKQLSTRVQRRVGPDDVVQSACRTFFRRVTTGQFDLPNAGALWRLLCAITVTKARRVARDQMRQKRGLDREHSLDARSSADDLRAVDPPSTDVTPFEQAALADQLSMLLSILSPEECQVLDCKLQQFRNDEIAERLACSERTVRRLTKVIQQKWNRMLEK